MAKKHIKRKFRQPQTRINDRIKSKEIRVVYGEYNLIIPTHKALNKARELGLDLVEVAPNAKPPVCRIVDYGKYKYELSKQKKSEKPKKKEKEIKFKVNIDPHDYKIKMTHAEDFLSHGYKVRVQLQFMGRQMAHKEIGFELMNRAKEDLKTMSQVDLEPKLNNRNILMMLSPLPKNSQKRFFRKSDEEIDISKIDEENTTQNDELSQEESE